MTKALLHLNESEKLLDIVAEGMTLYVEEKRRQWREEIDRELATLRAENAELKGMIGTVLRLVTKSDDTIVDLPSWRRDRA